MNSTHDVNGQVRAADLVRLGLGVLLLVRPELPATATRTPGGESVRTITRALGVRYVAQGALVMAVAKPRVLRVGAAIEGLHASSMYALAGIDRTHRRLALASAVLASGLTAADLKRLR